MPRTPSGQQAAPSVGGAFANASAPVLGKSGGRLKLDYLDGLRGLAALYVVLFHSRFLVMHYDLSPWTGRLTLWMIGGRAAVSIFIVLSGYCLMLPIARSSDGQLRGGTWSYLKRRAWRILPSYYSMLALSLLAMALLPHSIPHGAGEQRFSYETALPAFDPLNLVLHLTLLHNLHPVWVQKINGPLWSVATEWQIYFFLPLVLLPVWRVAGAGAMVVMAFFIGLLPHFLGWGDWTGPWLLGLFALGALGALFNFRFQDWSQNRPWFAWAGAMALLYVAYEAYYVPSWRARPNWSIWAPDVVVGLAAMCLLVDCTRHRMQATQPQDGVQPRVPLVLRILESPAATRLGRFSYSLYLTHGITLALIEYALWKASLPPRAWPLTVWLLGVPFCVLAAYVFHLVFEKRFMSAPGKRTASVV